MPITTFSLFRHIASRLRTSATLLVLGMVSQAVSAAGLLTPVGSNLPELQIRSHLVDVTIQDGYAITQVEQVFHNPHQQDLNALYAFPVPEQAAVSEFTVWIDGQPVTGEVLEKQAARQVHEEEKAAGRETGLAEQNGYRRFEVSVSPVRAGQDTRIRLQYIQPTDIQTGIGRYLYPLEEGGTDEDKLAFWSGNDVVTDHFRFTLNLRSSVAIDALRAPNIADASVTQTAPGEWTLLIDRTGSPAAQQSLLNDADINVAPIVNNDAIAISMVDEFSENAPLDNQSGSNSHSDNSGKKGSYPLSASALDTDLVIYWRMASNLPASVELTAYREGGGSDVDSSGKGTFMLVMTPGDDLAVIQEGRDWVFVLDISGSMKAKYATLVDGVRRAFKKMPVSDRFRIVLFNNHAQEITPGWVSVSPESIEQYSQAMMAVTPGQGTDLFAGLYKGLNAVENNRTTGLVLVTDGVANVGETHKREFVEILKRHDVRVFTLIMGNEANRPLLKSISEVSNGFALNISNSDDMVGKLMEATQRVNHQAMHGTELTLSGVRTSDVTPSHIGSVYRGEQIIVFGHYWGAGELSMTLSGKVSGERKQYQTSFSLPAVAETNPEIERLWAFASIDALQDEVDLYGEDDDLKQAMVGLAVEHGLVTEHTSMIVMRDEQFAARGIARNNQKRVQKEAKARQQRVNQPVAKRRVDQPKPMFPQPRASHSGAGALDAWWFLIYAPLLLVLFRKTAITSKPASRSGLKPLASSVANSAVSSVSGAAS